MPERPDMTPDPLADRLGRFTPEADGLDRAALLFQAGRASVRGRRFWPALAGLLAVAQVVTLSVLLTRPDPPQPVAPSVSQPAEPALPVVVPAPPASPERTPWIVSTWPSANEMEAVPVVKTVDHLVATGPPLSVRDIDRMSFRFD